jgi:predicted phage tail protein
VYAGLADGVYTFHVRAIDTVGNTGAATTRSWTVDTAGPDAPSISAGPADSSDSNDVNPSFTFSASDNAGGAGVASYECKLDGPGGATGSFGACTSPDAHTNLADGTYTFHVRAIDNAGNTGSATTRTWDIDTANPDAPSISAGPADSSDSNDNDPSFTFSASDNAGGTGVASYECRLDGPGGATGSFGACTSPDAHTNLADGTYTFHVRAIDNAGNTGAATTRTWTIDATGPDAPSISAGPADASATTSTSASFSFSATDNAGTGVASYECKLDGPGGSTGSWGACTSPDAYTSLADGAYTFHVRAIDNVGNTGSATTRTWTVDTTNPGAPSISSGPADTTDSNDADPSFSFTASDGAGGSGIASYECKLDDPGPGIASWGACTSPEAYTSLVEGTYTFHVRAIDNAGNTGSATTRTWNIDTTDPDAPSISDGPADASDSNDVSPSFSFSAADNAGGSGIVSYECRLDGPGGSTGSWAACTSPRAYTSLADGEYTFHVRAIDSAGNTGAATTRTWDIDATGPDAPSISTGPANASATTSTSASFAFTATDNTGGTGVASYECRLDGPGGSTGSWATCTSPRAYTSLAVGTYTFNVRAIDTAGNTGTTATRTWTIDTAEPDPPAVNDPTTEPGVDAANPNFTFAADDAGSGIAEYQCRLDGPDGTGTWATCTSPHAFSNLSAGTYTFHVRAVDQAGNASTTTRTWTVSSAPTSTPETAPAPAPTPAPSSNTRPAPACARRGLTVRRGQTVNAVRIARCTGLTIAKGARVKLSVPKSARKTCRISRERVVAKRPGRCTVRVTIVPRSGRKATRTVRVTVRSR